MVDETIYLLDIYKDRGEIFHKRELIFEWPIENTPNMLTQIYKIISQCDELRIRTHSTLLEHFKYFIMPINLLIIMGINKSSDLEYIIDYVLPYHVRIDKIFLMGYADEEFRKSEPCQTFKKIAKSKDIRLNRLLEM
jgi:hypothetical protein